MSTVFKEIAENPNVDVLFVVGENYSTVHINEAKKIDKCLFFSLLLEHVISLMTCLNALRLLWLHTWTRSPLQWSSLHRVERIHFQRFDKSPSALLLRTMAHQMCPTTNKGEQ